jgi:hypothetical protein
MAPYLTVEYQGASLRRIAGNAKLSVADRLAGCGRGTPGTVGV